MARDIDITLPPPLLYSYAAGYRPPLTGKDALKRGQFFVNVVDGVICHSRYGGAYVTVELGGGKPGPPGPPGRDGAPGPVGATGATGPAGADGKDGEPGPAGRDGLPGATGATGPAGADGKDGAPGAPGAPGADGAPGATGPAGKDGAPGATGATGATGPTGATGATGAAGKDGAPGATGPTGPAGVVQSVNGKSAASVTLFGTDVQMSGVEPASVRDAINGRVLADANGRVPPSRLAISTVNMAFNPDYAQGLAGYGLDFYTTPAAPQMSLRNDFAPSGFKSLAMFVPGSPSSGSFAQIISSVKNADGSLSRYKITPDTEYGISLCLSAIRCAGYMLCLFVDAGGNVVSQDIGTVVSENFANGGNYSDFPKSVLLKRSPSSAETLIILFRAVNFSGPDPYLFASALMLSTARAGATETSPYVAPGSTVTDGANLVWGSVPSVALFAPSRGQFFRALENSGSGRVAAIASAIPSDPSDAANIAFNHTTFVAQSGGLAQFVKTTLGLTDAQLATIIANARTVAE